MSFEKENMKDFGRYLLILGRDACLRRKLPNLTEGKWHLFLERTDTKLLADLEFVFEFHQGCLLLDGKMLSDKSPFYYYTEEGEKLLFMLSAKIEYLEPSDRVFLKMGENIRIGNAYTNRIFYDCFSLAKTIHAEIFWKQQGEMIMNSGQEGVYVNEKAVQGHQILRTGDRIDIYGLHLLVLGELLICVTFCGVCRVAEGRNMPETLLEKESNKKEEKGVEREWDQQADVIERNCEQEEALYTGEVEVILPDKPAVQPRQSIFLSLGPSLTMVLPMLLMAQLGSRYMGGTGSGFYYMSVVMSVCTAFLAVFWGLVNHWYSKFCRKQEEKEKQQQYREYLKGIEEYLFNCQNENRRILEQRYPAFTRLLKEKNGTTRVLWNRYYRQKDFLFLRLGIGKMDFQMQVKLSGGTKGIIQGKLSKEAEEMAKNFTFLSQVPVGVDLYENRQIGLVSKTGQEKEQGAYENNIKEVLFQLLMQIVICHCYTEVKIVCFYHSGRTLQREISECLKWVPHCWSTDRRTRYLAGNEQEAAEILPVLTRELVKGAGSVQEGISIPWYIVVMLNKELIMGEPLYQYLTDPNELYPVSVVFAGERRETIPKSCRCFLTGYGQKGECLNLGNEQLIRRQLLLDTSSLFQVQDYVRRITGLRVREMEGDGRLPDQVDFLQLYGCSKIEELDSGRRWQLARPEERLKVPIGCSAGGNLISLDVHEKFHGPHGLVAGTTGSGKSELLQTYLLSIAVSYSPADVNFFMIDYKGGGTGNILKGLPHCAGVISNLSGKQIKRAMSAISSENKRRQKLLGEFQVNHIDAYSRLYREGKAVKPMPHLILVVDEFAELKKEEPEFMQEIISLAQVGRSLGVHLILATQKPAGTVDDKIWSNARFRMCLKVQDKQDSMDMLKNGDAAALTAPGQCYMQIGNQEYYELFQAGYCGGIYKDGGKEKAKAVLVSNTGKRRERKTKTDASKGSSQIQVLVDYVNHIAEQCHYGSASQLWMPELPDKVVIRELQQWEQEGKEVRNETGKLQDLVPQVILGLCDDPENQRQFVLTYQPLIQGHLAICGSPGTGKTTLLQTILWQLCNEYRPQQVLVLAVSMGQESFGCFLHMPGCLGVLKEKKDKEVFLYHLKKMVHDRRKQLQGISCQQYNQCGKESLPYIFLIIDNFGSFARELQDEQEEFILKLASEGISLGIFLILSATAVNEISTRLFEKIKTTVALEMSDRFQYGDVLRQYYLPVLPEENRKGRGLCKVQGNVLEFQSALALREMVDYVRFHLIEEAGRKKQREMLRQKMMIPMKFPVLPEKPEFHRLAEDYVWKDEKIPIGYCLATGEVLSISLAEAVCFLISGNERTGRTTFLTCMIEGLLHLGGQAVVIDGNGRLKHFREREGITYLVSDEEVEEWRNFVQTSDEKSWKRMMGVFLSDMGSFCHRVEQSGDKREERIRFWEQLAMGKRKDCFLMGIYNPVRDLEAAGTGFFREFTSWQYGICLGGNLASQRTFAFDDLNYAIQSRSEPPGIGYLKQGPGSATRRLLLPTFKTEGENDDTG